MIFENRKEAEEHYEIYSPDYERKLLEFSETCNYGLMFQKMCRWQVNGIPKRDTGIEEYYTGRIIKDKKEKKKESVRSDYAEYLQKRSSLLKTNEVKKALQQIHIRQTNFITFFSNICLNQIPKTSFEIHAKTVSPFITGLGSGHPTETGMILDRNTGLPYIPASSIKGVCLLSYAIYLAKKGFVDEKGNITKEGMSKIEELFGTQDENTKIKKRGQLVFLDAYPAKIPELCLDIINPHFGSYYAGDKPTDGRNNELKKQPIETESPKPIKFLTVKKGTEFVFRCFYLPLDKEQAEDVSTDVKEMFNKAFETVGFGGKTSIGYGRFKSY